MASRPPCYRCYPYDRLIYFDDQHGISSTKHGAAVVSTLEGRGQVSGGPTWRMFLYELMMENCRQFLVPGPLVASAIYSSSPFMGVRKLNHGNSFDNIDIHAILTYRDRHDDHWLGISHSV